LVGTADSDAGDNKPEPDADAEAELLRDELVAFEHYCAEAANPGAMPSPSRRRRRNCDEAG
jgi:hypothetical protein